MYKTSKENCKLDKTNFCFSIPFLSEAKTNEFMFAVQSALQFNENVLKTKRHQIPWIINSIELIGGQSIK